MKTTAALPSRHRIVLDQLIVVSDFPLPERHRLLEDLNALRATLSVKLALPVSDEPVHVFLFAKAEDYHRFMRANYPRFPDRRAFFVESDTRLAVYAYWGDRVAEDLRHETAHGYLHAAARNLPLWLDEGLAEYFEIPAGRRGLSHAHLQELAAALARDWRPDLRRLEAIASPSQMTQLDYAEAWAWMQFSLETTAERRSALQEYLRSLAQAQTAESYSLSLRKIDLDYERQLLEHLRRLIQAL